MKGRLGAIFVNSCGSVVLDLIAVYGLIMQLGQPQPGLANRSLTLII